MQSKEHEIPESAKLAATILLAGEPRYTVEIYDDFWLSWVIAEEDLSYEAAVKLSSDYQQTLGPQAVKMNKNELILD